MILFSGKAKDLRDYLKNLIHIYGGNTTVYEYYLMRKAWEAVERRRMKHLIGEEMRVWLG